MARVRISTTVDGDLLAAARAISGAETDAALIDETLDAFLRERRRAQIDKQFEAYDRIPIDTPDEWGDLASWRDEAARS